MAEHRAAQKLGEAGRPLPGAFGGQGRGMRPADTPILHLRPPPSPTSFLGPLLGPSWELIPQCTKSPWGVGVASSPHRRPARLSQAFSRGPKPGRCAGIQPSPRVAHSGISPCL